MVSLILRDLKSFQYYFMDLETTKGGGLANKLTMKLVLHILQPQAPLFNCNKWKNYKRETNGSVLNIYYE